MERKDTINLSCGNSFLLDQKENEMETSSHDEFIRNKPENGKISHEDNPNLIKDFIEKLLFDRQNFGKTKPSALFLTALETVLLSLAVSTVDLNIITPWSKNTHFYFMRTCVIVLSLLFCLLEKLLFRSLRLNYTQSLVLTAFSHFLFSYVYIYPKIPMVSVNGFIFINKIQISTILFLNLATSFFLSLYMTFLSYCIYNFPTYTQTSGLFVYLKQSFYSIAGDSKNVFLASLKLSVVFSMIYFGSVNLILRFIAFFLRIQLLNPSFFYLCIHILAVSLSNTVYFFSNLIINHLIVFNSSYSSSKTGNMLYNEIDGGRKEEKRLWFHKTAQTHKKIRNNPMLIKSMHEYILFEMSELENVLSLMDNCKRRLDDTLYTAVPQVNKNYTKKVKECSILQAIGLKVRTQFEMFIFRRKYSVYYEFLANALSFVSNERGHGSLSPLSVEIISQISDLVKLIKKTESAFKLDLQSENLEKYVIN